MERGFVLARQVQISASVLRPLLRQQFALLTNAFVQQIFTGCPSSDRNCIKNNSSAHNAIPAFKEIRDWWWTGNSRIGREEDHSTGKNYGHCSMVQANDAKMVTKKWNWRESNELGHAELWIWILLWIQMRDHTGIGTHPRMRGSGTERPVTSWSNRQMKEGLRW